MADLKLHHGSIFEKISIVEMGILVLLSQVSFSIALRLYLAPRRGEYSIAET